jgi:hypothetical protein
MKDSPSPDWIALKKSMDREYSQVRSLGGDADAALDLSWALQHPGEAGNVLEVRTRRKAIEADILKNAAEEEARIKEERQAARRKDATWFEITFRPYIERQESEALDGDILAVAMNFIGLKDFIGTLTDLWNMLNRGDIIDRCKIDTRDPSWPKSARILRKRLPMLASNLGVMKTHVYENITYSEAHTRFGDAIHKIPKGRTPDDFIKQDRIIIISPTRLKALTTFNLELSTHEDARSTVNQRNEKGIC